MLPLTWPAGVVGAFYFSCRARAEVRGKMEEPPQFEVVSAQSITDEQRMAAAVILSAHWRKDPASRVAELSKSMDTFPLHLVLLRRSMKDGAAIAIGHCRITRVDGTGEQASLIESGSFLLIDPICS